MIRLQELDTYAQNIENLIQREKELIKEKDDKQIAIKFFKGYRELGEKIENELIHIRSEIRRLSPKTESLQDKWKLKRFLQGLRDFSGEKLQEKGIVIVPTERSVNEKAVYLAKKGIENLLLEPVGLELTIGINKTYTLKDSNPEVVSKNRKETSEGLITKDYNVRFNFKDLIRKKIIPDRYIVCIDRGDFFSGETKKSTRMCGFANLRELVCTVLDRGLRKGRFLDGKLIEMDEKQKENYMKTIAAHEAYHIIAQLGEKKDKDNLKNGYEIEPHCLGYSTFKMPVTLCERCKEGIIYFWHGLELRDNKQYLRPGSL